jgi:HSP20 family protein
MNLVRWRNRKDRTALERPNFMDWPRSFSQEMDRIFDRFAQEFGWATTGFGSAIGWAPALDVTETDQEIVVRAEIPGIDPQDVDVQVSGRLLTVSGEKREAHEEKRGATYRAERRFGRFRRTIELPSAVEVDQVSARIDKGVLTITLPRSERSRPKRVEIKVD